MSTGVDVLLAVWATSTLAVLVLNYRFPWKPDAPAVTEAVPSSPARDGVRPSGPERGDSGRFANVRVIHGDAQPFVAFLRELGQELEADEKQIKAEEAFFNGWGDSGRIH